VELNALREETLARCNALRARMGLPPVRRMAALERSAQAHAEYLDRNAARGHFEQRGRRGFTGKTLLDRMGAAGYEGGGGEVAAYEETAGEAFDAWMASVYHREFATHPALAGLGLGVCGRVQVLDYAVDPEPRSHTIACLPANLQQDVPLAWHGREAPSPLPEGFAGPVGCTISAHFPDAILRVDQVSLTAAGGTAVPCFTRHRLNDPNLKGSAAVFLLPQSPLQPGVTYRATIAVETAAGPEQADWTFRTAGP
jgi:hypothetical protein